MKNSIEEFSILYLINTIKDWIKYIFDNSKKIFLFTSIFIILYTSYNYLKSPTYYARTSFVLDNDSASNSMGDIASLASLAGINASSFIDASNLFQIDNIQELYKSSSMLKQTLLSEFDFDDEKEKLIYRFGKKEKIDKKWNRLKIDFNNSLNISRPHDSIIFEAIKLIREKYLIVEKPSRKTTIIEIGFDHKDELLAKSFNENLVKIVNEFYFITKTQKTGENLTILQRQADSVKNVLDKSILALAEKDQSIPNPNPLTKVSRVPYQKALIDVQSNGAIYQEILKQLELAKVAHRNKSPLIQIIDRPTLPLENSRLKFFECIISGLLYGLTLTIIYLTLFRFYNSVIIKQNLT